MAKKKKLKAKIAELETELMQMRKDMRCLIMEPNTVGAFIVEKAYKQGYRLEAAIWAGDCSTLGTSHMPDRENNNVTSS